MTTTTTKTMIVNVQSAKHPRKNHARGACWADSSPDDNKEKEREVGEMDDGAIADLKTSKF